MMITEDEITKIFCMADDFCKIYDKFIMINGLGPKRDRRKREYHRASKMSDSEVITIMILFHFSGYKCLKHFYVRYVLVSYSGVVQQVHRVGEESNRAVHPVPEEVPDGRVHRDKFCGQHGTESLPEPEDTHAWTARH